MDDLPAIADAEVLGSPAGSLDGLAELFADARVDSAPQPPLEEALSAEETFGLDMDDKDERPDDASPISGPNPAPIPHRQRSAAPRDFSPRHLSPVLPSLIQSRSRSRETFLSIVDSDIVEDVSAEDWLSDNEQTSDFDFSDDRDEEEASDASDKSSVVEEMEMGSAVAELLQKAWDPVCHCGMRLSKKSTVI